MAGHHTQGALLLHQGEPPTAQPFRNLVARFIDSVGRVVALPHGAPQLQNVCSVWLITLGDESNLHVYEEAVGEDNAACDHCRIMGALQRRSAGEHGLPGPRAGGAHAAARRGGAPAAAPWTAPDTTPWCSQAGRATP